MTTEDDDLRPTAIFGKPRNEESTEERQKDKDLEKFNPDLNDNDQRLMDELNQKLNEVYGDHLHIRVNTYPEESKMTQSGKEDIGDG